MESFVWKLSARVNLLFHGKQQPVTGFLNSVCHYLDTKNDSAELSKVAIYLIIKVRWFLWDLCVRSTIKTAAEKLLLMTYASHVRVITGIIQANLIHSNEEPHSWANGFFKIGGFAGKRSLLSPPPPPAFPLFALAPFFACPECEKHIRAARM